MHGYGMTAHGAKRPFAISKHQASRSDRPKVILDRRHSPQAQLETAFLVAENAALVAGAGTVMPVIFVPLLRIVSAGRIFLARLSG
jgi:hypothetical protein